MIILTNPISLYGKKVVVDLATRSGEAKEDDYSCTLGLNYVVNKYWSGEDTEASIEMLFADQTDFNADIVQPHMNDDEYSDVIEQEEYNKVARYNPAVDKTDFDKYFRRLEDIAWQYLEKYVSNLVFTVCKYNGGAKAFEALHREQPTLVSNDDSEEFTELADLQLYGNENDWSPDVKQTAITKLPYVLKRLHNLSCYCGVHMISFIVAYLKAKERNMNARISGSQKSLKKNAVISEGVYLCNEYGDITKKVTVQSKNVKAAKMFDWIIGMDKDFKAYYQDYLNFVHYCNVLNVDLLNDDMTKYASEFMSKLVVTTVTPNNQYDKQVYEAILRNSSVTEVPVVRTFEETLLNTFNTFNQICSTNANIQSYVQRHDYITSKQNMDMAMSIYNLYSIIYLKQATDSTKYSWENGYLYYDDTIAVVTASFLGEADYDEVCVISELGYCVQLTESLGVYVMVLRNALNNITNKVVNKDPDYRYESWVQLTV